MRSLVALLLLVTSCTTVEKGDCLDWRHYKTREQVCTPVYGNLICVERDVIKYFCVLREDPDVKDADRSVS